MRTLTSRYVSIQDFAGELRKFPESAFKGTAEILEFLARTHVNPDTLTPYISVGPAALHPQPD